LSAKNRNNGDSNDGDESARAWTLAGAREVLGDVRTRTESAFLETERLQAIRNSEDTEAEAKLEAEAQLRSVVSLWIREMEALGLEVKGAWLVDFDSGSGYYCWRWPETDVEYFHSYDEGFEQRIRIQ
jgi:hypothetical protein